MTDRRRPMLASLSRDVGTCLHDVFVAEFDPWLAFGLGAQPVFTARFLVRWIGSEREGRSVIPVASWVPPIVGGLVTLAYGLARRDAIIILGQVLSPVIYGRNLALLGGTSRSGRPKR